MSAVARLIDIMAWMRLNVFHWHLSDDEAWRLEIKAYPTLTTLGVLRGPDEPMLPQLGNGAVPVAGHYSQEDVRAIVAHAGSLNVSKWCRKSIFPAIARRRWWRCRNWWMARKRRTAIAPFRAIRTMR